MFISSHLPSAKIPQAGQKLALDILKGYSDDYNVFLLSFYNDFEGKYLDEKKYGFCQESYFYRMSALDKVVSIVSNVASPLKSVVRANAAAEIKIMELQSRIEFDVVHFYFTEAAYYLKLFENKAVQTVITQIDVCYQAIDRKRKVANLFVKLLYDFEYNRQKKWELNVLNKANIISVLNFKDKNILVGDGIPDEKITITKPIVSSAFSQIKRTSIENCALLFWGAMNRKENVDGIIWFLKDIFPKICLSFPDTKLYIVGTNPPSEILKLQSKQIVITGFVDDPMQYFEKCHVAIAPLRMGAGIKIKVLEYLAAGLPVVATTVGAEGIDESSNLFVTDMAAEFATEVCNLFKSTRN